MNLLHISNYNIDESKIDSSYQIRSYQENKATLNDYLWADVIVGKVDPNLLKQASQVKFVQLETAGNDTVLKAMNKDTILCNASGSFGVAISEYVIGSILMMYRHLHEYYQYKCHHKWDKITNIETISGKRVLIIGTGDLGSECAKRFQAMNAKTFGISLSGKAKTYFDEVYSNDQLQEQLACSDIIVLTLPNTKQTNHYFKKEYYDKMKPTSILVNVGRGSLLSLEELSEAIKAKKIAGAILDVYEQEPLAENHCLWDLPNVLMTPHISGTFHSDDAYQRYERILYHNLNAYLKQEPLLNVVDIEKEY